MFHLSAPYTAKLIDAPETSMGYQVVLARINAQRDLYVVFNAELAVSRGELPGIRHASFEALIAKAETPFEVDLLTVYGTPPGEPPPSDPEAPPSPFAPTPILLRTTQAYEGFARISAYPNDRRVNADGSLRPGTYTTSAADLRGVLSGFAAVGRYALPNPVAACFVYGIVPGPGVSILCGTVRPAFSQSGGGVEVLFPDGAPPGSGFRPYSIPEI